MIASIIALGAHAQVQCEDTCRHVHGIDLSHYQGNVFWETVGDNSKTLAYVYLKATEGGTNIDSKYKKNIDLAHRYGMKVGSYHFYRPPHSTADAAGKFHGPMPSGRSGPLAYD